MVPAWIFEHALLWLQQVNIAFGGRSRALFYNSHERKHKRRATICSVNAT